MIRMFSFGAVVVALAVTTACTDLRPLQAQVDDLKEQVARMSSDEVSLKSAVDNSAQTASRRCRRPSRHRVTRMQLHRPLRRLSRAVMQ